MREIRSSESFGSLTHRQRDLFQGLIEVADDQGRLPGTAAAVRSEVWKYDDIPLPEVQAELDVLAGGTDPFIVIYCVKNKTYLQVINWWRYQPMAWAQASAYPAPKGWTDRVRVQTTGRKVHTENWDQPGGFATRLPSALHSTDVDDDVEGNPGDVVNINDNHKVKNNNKDKDKDKDNTPPTDENLTLSRAQEAWSFAKAELLSEGMNQADYNTWLENLRVDHVDGSQICISAVNRYAVDWVASRCKSLIDQRIRGFLGDSRVEVVITCKVDHPPGKKSMASPLTPSPSPSGRGR